jgi:bifunctional non-homologous end joining protein LigD
VGHLYFCASEVHQSRPRFVEPMAARVASALPEGPEWGGGVTAEEMDEMQWVKPKLVAQIRFVEWTAEGHLRHAVFVALRDAKESAAVRREP